MNDKNNVSEIWAPAEEDLRGYCPHCGADVMEFFNEKRCGDCGKKIKWDIEVTKTYRRKGIDHE